MNRDGEAGRGPVPQEAASGRAARPAAPGTCLPLPAGVRGRGGFCAPPLPASAISSALNAFPFVISAK